MLDWWGNNEFKELKKQLNKSKEEKSIIENKLKQLEKEKTTLQTELKKIATEKEKIQKKVAEVDEEKEEIKSKLVACETAQKSMQAKLAETEKSKEEVGAKLEEVETEKVELQSKLAETEKSKEEVETEKSELQAKLAETQKLKEEVETEKSELQAKLAETEKSKEEVEVKLEEVETEKSELQSKLAETEKSKEEVEAKLVVIEGEKSELQSKLEETETEKTNIQSKLDACEIAKIEIEKAKDKEITELKAQLKDQNKEVTNPKIGLLEKRLEQLEKKLVKQKEEIKSIENDLDTIEDINDHIKLKDITIEQINKIKKQLEELKKEEENKNTLIFCKSLMEKLEEIKSQIANKTDDSKCCETINEKLDQLVNYNNDKTMKEIENLNKNLEAKNQEIKELEDKIKNHVIPDREEIKTKLDELNETKNNLNQVKEEAIKNGNQEKVNEIDKEIKALEVTETKIKQQMLEIEKQENEKKVLEEKLKNSQLQIAKLEKEKNDLEVKIKNNNTCSETEVIGEFTLKKTTLVEEFNSGNKIWDTVINKVKKHYPDIIINEDYKIEFENLNPNDIVQGKELKVKVTPTKNGKVKNEFNFIIKINYEYDAAEQRKAATQILSKAIPQEFWKDRKDKKYLTIRRNNYKHYLKIADMIKNVKPLPILLNERHLTSKIMAETFAASYWTNYHIDFWGLWVNLDNGYYPTHSTIPSTKKDNKIRNVKDLSELNNTYFNTLFLMIEKYLNESGVNCRVSKKAVKDYYSYLYLYGVGNVAFNNWGYNGSYENFDDESKRQYYIQVNFDVLFADKSDDFSVGASEEFAGVVLTLTDDLTLYS